MIFLSTKPNDTCLLNIAVHELNKNTPRMHEVELLINILSNSDDVDIKLNLIQTLTFQGERKDAIKILNTLNPKISINENHICRMGLANMRLFRFDEAENCFNIIEKKGYISPDLFFYKSLLFFCLEVSDKAEYYIKNHMLHNNIQFNNQLLYVEILNKNGQHTNALTQADRLLTESGNTFNQKCAGFTEKGNTFRYLGKYKEACAFYRKALKTFPVGGYSICIAHFEYAMTLIYLGEIDKASTIAWNGCVCVSNIYSNVYNPCVILYYFLQHYQDRSNEDIQSPLELAKNAKLWPFPRHPHKTWMLLFVAILLKEKGAVEESQNLIYEIITNSVIKKKHQLEELLMNIESWCSDEYFNNLSLSIFANDFNWRVIKQIAVSGLSK